MRSSGELKAINYDNFSSRSYWQFVREVFALRKHCNYLIKCFVGHKPGHNVS